jgi:hypothetical protein
LSKTIISNRDSQFVSLVWNTLCKILQIKAKLFTTFHFESDEQSENTNQKLKRYLWTFMNYQQNDWIEWLSMTKFTFNACISVFIDIFSFSANYDFESHMSFDSQANVAEEKKTTRKRMWRDVVINIEEKMRIIWDFARDNLIKTQVSQKEFVDRHKIETSKYEVEQKI